MTGSSLLAGIRSCLQALAALGSYDRPLRQITLALHKLDEIEADDPAGHGDRGAGRIRPSQFPENKLSSKDVRTWATMLEDKPDVEHKCR
jgi:hypothetical protein